MSMAPVALFAYKRKDKLSACLQALENNYEAKETELFIFSDGSKDETDISQVTEVREFLDSYINNNKFKSVKIICQSQNKGLANSIISGVTSVIREYGKIIVVEDDLITSQDFLSYMNQALDFYQEDKEYGSISGYTYPLVELNSYTKDVYVTRKGECWGWATWIDRWENVDWEVSDFNEYLKNKKKRNEFDKLQHGIDKMLIMQMNGKIDSWAVRWCYFLFNNKLLTVYPRISKTKNIGFDGSGTHCSITDIYNAELNTQCAKYKFERIGVDKQLEKKAAAFESRNIFNSILNIMRRIF